MKQGDIIRETVEFVPGVVPESDVILISGASSHIGKYVAEYFKKYYPEKRIITTSRRDAKWSDEHYCVDLTKRRDVEEFISSLRFEKGTHLTYFQCVATFKWEEGSVDPEVFRVTSMSFRYVVDALTKLNLSFLTVVNFGSISNGRVPFWRSFDIAHLHNKSYLQLACLRNTKVRGAYFFVSSIHTPNEVVLRPCKPKDEIDKEWMKVEEVVEVMIPEILDRGYRWKSIDIFKFQENFRKDYFTNHDALYEKWKKDMGS